MLFSFAAASTYAPSTAVGAQWFQKKRGIAIGIITTGGAAGGVVYPIMIQRFFGLMSYRNSMLTIACFNFALMLPAVFFMKARLPPHKPPPVSDMKRPWHQTQYVFLVLGSALYTMKWVISATADRSIMSPFYHGLVFARANNVPQYLSVYAIAMAGAGSVIGRLGTGFLADRFGVWNVFGTLGFVSSIVMFAFWTPPNIGTAPTLIGLIFIGAVSGGWWCLIASATAAISPLREVGMRIGMLITCCSIPTLVGPVICGGGSWCSNSNHSVNQRRPRPLDVCWCVLRRGLPALRRGDCRAVDHPPQTKARRVGHAVERRDATGQGVEAVLALVRFLPCCIMYHRMQTCM